MRFTIGLAAAMFGLAGVAQTNQSLLAARDFLDPSVNKVTKSTWTTAKHGEFTVMDDKPAKASKTCGEKGVRVALTYGARKFQYWALDLGAEAPGTPKKISMWVRQNGKNNLGCEVVVQGAEYDEVGKDGKPVIDEKTKKPKKKRAEKKLYFGPDAAKSGQTVGEWKLVEYVWDKVAPKDFLPPLKVASISFNNWGERNAPEDRECGLDLYGLVIETDVSSVPVAERPWTVQATFPATANVFYHGEQKPEVVVGASSWLGTPVSCTVEASVTRCVEAGDGLSVALKPVTFTCGTTGSAKIPLGVSDPGAYRLKIKVKGFPQEKTFEHRFAIAVHPPELTPEQKFKSIYGLCVHGGDYVGYPNFSRLGLVWVRDYAFNYWWMVRANGGGDFGGWPWYPKIFAAAKDAGMLTLPCLMHSMKEAYSSNAKDTIHPEPTLEWRVNIAKIVAAFPDQTVWELDNEKDGTRWGNTAAYQAYHKAFAEILHAVNPNATAVAEGGAGIYEDADGELIKGGFKGIDVLNGHRYCGVDAPEYSRKNTNTGMADAKKTYLKDLWRTWKRNGSADGKNRECWVTEWGFDTRAGQIVTEWEQAAYLQREWVLAMECGISKMFWYWYYDSNCEVPKNFFDGCGLYDRFHEPKPAAPAMAALRMFLPADYTHLGYANIDENHMAHVLECGGKLVACAFKIKLNGPDLAITDPKASAVYDMFGGKLKAGKRTLGIDPVWYVGLDPDCDWVRQAPMEIESEFFCRNVPGETLPIKLRDADKYTYTVKAPAGWTVVRTVNGFDVTSPLGLTRGVAQFEVEGVNGKAVKKMVIDCDVIPQAFVKSDIAAMDGSFKVKVKNQSSDNQVYTVKAQLPAGWQVEPSEAVTPELKPDGEAELKFKLVAHKPIAATETKDVPRLAVSNAKGAVIDSAPVSPRVWRIHRVKKPVLLDGNLDEWNDADALPRWMLGPRGDAEQSRFFAMYDTDGLYIAAEVADSKCETSDPNSFWRAADCLELMVATPPSKGAATWSWTLDDHQFWFCPLAKENRMFAGLWSNTKEQKGGSDLADVKSYVRQTADGYITEIFIPVSRLHGWDATKGKTIGLAFTLTVRGHRDDRIFYWTTPKNEMAAKHPWKWGKVELAD